MNPTPIKIHQHLFEIYPSMPKYAADPSESQIIKIHDHLMLRFAGHYGRQPEYFIKAPLSAVLFGDSHQYVGLPTVSFNSSQSIIIAVSKTSAKKIRLNHYETTLFGELELPSAVNEWKFTKPPVQQNFESFSMNGDGDKIKNEQQNLVTKVLKVFAQTNNLMELSGMDLLVYKDFVEEQFLYSREAFIYGLYTAVHTCMMRKVPLDDRTLHKAFQKISDASTSHVQGLPQLVHGSYGNLTYSESLTQQPKNLKFPEGYSLIVANTMTPQPKKMIRGKRFNLRQCQVQIGIELVLSQLGIVKEVRSIKHLMETLECNTKEMLDTIESSIPNKGMGVEEIEGLLERPLADVLKHVQFAANVIDENVEFHPYRRIKFFLEEQLIIESLASSESLSQLQSLLTKSSSNAKSLLEISSEQIEDVQKIITSFNSGCKVAGNGWGGCVAILCKQEMVEQLYVELVEKFYLAQKNRILLGDDVEVYVKVVGRPQLGVSVLDPSNEIWFG